MLSISAGFVGLTLVAARAVAQNTAEECFADGYVNPCMGFAMDFHDGGSYFQNISSPDDFTFSSQFEGCQADAFANNLLVDPNGDQYLCTDTDIFPDDTTETSTCPLEKQQMWSGDWTVVIISNNGENGCPIAIQRDFELTVAEPSTEVYTPTVTIPTVITPVETSTSVTTTTDWLTVTSTVTSPKYTLKPTTTITPKRVTTTQTVTIGTIRKTAYTAIPVVKTKTLTKTCSLPHRATKKDKKATVTPTLVTAAALQITTIPEPTPEPRMRRAPLDAEGRLLQKQAFVAERRAWLEENGQLEKRGLDVATTTVTESDHNDFNLDRSSNNNDHYLRSYYDEYTTNDYYALEREDDIIPSNRHRAYPDQNQNQIHFHNYNC
ncbi:hypothetical protein D0869_04185 [Hortaea werneckii]|uniref:Uncharacterized protein n=1 Tax=Hortaea werneckii TaxID=91943 RepID=A0A3M7ACL3_HORWE|nr:hypothetical protein KC334_g2902 [Hortaea werneckii]KAI7026986.1 hypothetical protein KC355_g480 [Hortaea werneckii]KAI7205230.1 hypothetical protein KC324_g414 [Hortaea werneckii]KAI7595709.1 hypothetical protein KC316_g349 [Hortaea werneckii]KAI7672867.1 hypothetical protein KC318_g2575 [Hortaea werneckii]